MQSSNKVSVVMSVYNGARYVRGAVESILTQSLGNIEFVIVNDGSTDNTLEILRQFDDERLVILNNETNTGLAHSLNRGIRATSGEYMARQDADDISLQDRLSMQMEFLNSYTSVGVVGTSAQWIDGENQPLRIWPPGQSNAELQESLLWTCPLIHGSTMYRRQAFEEVGGYDEGMRTGQDYDLWLRISESWDLECISDVLYLYRRHEGMASSQWKDEQAQNARNGLNKALMRRIDYSRSLIRMDRKSLPPRLSMMDRSQLAQRFVWWSSGARGISRGVALQFLIISFLLNPMSSEIRSFVRGILLRKIKSSNLQQSV